MMNTRSKSSLQKGKGSKLKNKRGPDKHGFVSKCSKTVNRTLNRSSSTTRKEKKKKSDVPCSRKITEYFFESPKTQASNNNNNLDLIGFRKGTLSPICVTSDSKVDHNDTENRSRTRYEFNNATDCSWETIYFDGKPCKSEKSRDDKFTHSVNVSGEANALTNNMEIEKPTVCDIPSYQQIIKDKKDCDTYIREVQNLVSLLPDTPEKSPASHHYNTRSRSKSSSNEERTPKTKQKLESKVDSPNKMSAEKSKRKLNFEKLKKENCDQLSNISNKKSLPERSQDSYNSTRSRSKISSSERHQHHGYQTRSKSVSSNSQSPKAAKHEILVRDKKANSKARKSRERQKKNPKQKISKFFERTPKTKQKLESKVDSPNKMSAGKSKRKLDFEKLEKENCDQLSNISNKKSLPERSLDLYNSTRSRSKSSSSERHQHHGYQTRSKSVSSNSQSPKAAKHEILVRDKKVNSKARKSRERQKKSPKQKISKFFERTPKTKEKLESKVDSPNKMSAGKSKRKLDFEKLEKENCDRLPITSNKKNLESKKSSTTFRRYGIYVPSYEDILSEKKHYDDYSNLVDSLTKLVVPLPEIKINDYDSPPVQIKVLNCKHMSKEALFRAYENNIQYMEDIISEKIMSERHEKYKRVATREELTYNTSMITFTNEQKQLLVADLCEKFGQTSAHSDYYFKVLLPELCLKIFMDEHAMSREEATEYLDCYPV